MFRPHLKVDLVTEWDVRVEDFVKGEIRSAYPAFELSVFISDIQYRLILTMET